MVMRGSWWCRDVRPRCGVATNSRAYFLAQHLFDRHRTVGSWRSQIVGRYALLAGVRAYSKSWLIMPMMLARMARSRPRDSWDCWRRACERRRKFKPRCAPGLPAELRESEANTRISIRWFWSDQFADIRRYRGPIVQARSRRRGWASRAMGAPSPSRVGGRVIVMPLAARIARSSAIVTGFDGGCSHTTRWCTRSFAAHLAVRPRKEGRSHTRFSRSRGSRSHGQRPGDAQCTPRITRSVLELASRCEKDDAVEVAGSETAS